MTHSLPGLGPDRTKRRSYVFPPLTVDSDSCHAVEEAYEVRESAERRLTEGLSGISRPPASL